MTVLDSQLAETATKVNQFIEKIVNLRGEPKLLYHAARHVIDAGGKRLRPYLVLKSCRLVGGKEEDAIPTAVSIELLHTFTLIHDDIMDQDEKRRGVSTVHTKWDLPTAIVAGDLVFAKVYQTLINCTNPNRIPPESILEVMRCLNESAIKICEGQALDMIFENKETISEKEYFRMIGAKTAALFAASAKSGGIVGGGSTAQIEQLGEFGACAGFAFQLVDDVLGLTADEQVLGKPVGSDIREGKRTLIIIHALQNSSKEQRKEILKTLGNSLASVEQTREITDLLSSLGSISYAEKKAIEYIEKSKRALEAFPDTKDRADLLGLTELIVARKR